MIWWPLHQYPSLISNGVCMIMNLNIFYWDSDMTEPVWPLSSSEKSLGLSDLLWISDGASLTWQSLDIHGLSNILWQGWPLADCPGKTRDGQSNSDCQRYSDRGGLWVTIPGQPGMVRVTVTLRDTLTCKESLIGPDWPDNPVHPWMSALLGISLTVHDLWWQHWI